MKDPSGLFMKMVEGMLSKRFPGHPKEISSMMSDINSKFKDYVIPFKDIVFSEKSKTRATFHYLDVDVSVFNGQIESGSALHKFFKMLAAKKKLRHSNIPQFIGLSCDDKQNIFVFTESLRQFESLELHLKNKIHLDSYIKLKIFFQIARTLTFLYSLQPPIPHGNLIFSSIMVTENFEIKLTSFQ